MKKLLAVLLTVLAFKAKAQNMTTQTTGTPRFRITVQGGFSQLLAKTSEAVPAENRNYVSELKSGYHYGADVSYFVTNTWGLGAKISQFNSSNSGMISGTDQMGNLVKLVMDDNIKHTFIGPSFTTKHTTLNNKHTFLFGVALGYLGYVNNSLLGDQPIKVTGATFGSALDAAYDLSITNNIAIGAQLSVTGGTLSKLTYSSGGMTSTQTFEKDEKESMTRLDFSLGARFNF